jgi:type II secretory pathway component PulF
MQETLLQSLPSNPLLAAGWLVLVFLGYLAIGVLPAAAAVYLVYFLLTLPMRRNERARIFIDALELGLRQGKTAEDSIIAVSASRDRSFGARFYLLAEYLRAGTRLSEALGQVPRLLQPQVAAMLHAGERIGDITKVLPACRQVLKDGVSQVRGALNYLILVVFVASPVLVLIPVMTSIKVLPRYRQIFSEMSGQQLPALSRFIFDEQSGFMVVQIATILFLWISLLAYLGGPRLSRWLGRIAPTAPDRIALLFPWRRKRMQRDFSSILALLLDTGMPEPEAVLLAGEATGHGAIIKKRAVAVAEALRQGVKLPDALKAFDAEGELKWRISNAAHNHTGFAKALAGWHETLDAKAFQLEQSAAQIATTIFVLINGFIVGCFVIGIFMALIQLTGSALW